MKLKTTLSQLSFVLYLAAILYSGNLYAETYYVSNGGNDANSGTTPAQAWQTIDKVHATTLQPGDSVLFNSGDVFRDQLTLQQSGTNGNNIFFGAYGSGDKPAIFGSEVSTWSSAGSNVWVCDISLNYNPFLVNFGEYGSLWFVYPDDSTAWGQYDGTGTQPSAEEYHWTYDNNKVYVYSTTDPDIAYKSIEICQRQASIFLNNQDYVTIDGLELGYGSNAGIWEKWPNSMREVANVRNCYIHHVGIIDSPSAYGVYIWHNNSVVENNHIADCGRRGVSVIGTSGADEMTIHDIHIRDNLFENGWHTTGLDLNSEAGSQTNIRDIYFYRNRVYDYDEVPRPISPTNASTNGAFIANQSGGVADVSHIYYYNNIHTYNTTGVKLEYVDSVYIVHNTFFQLSKDVPDGSTGSLQSLVQISGADDNTVIMKNNILHIDKDDYENQQAYLMYPVMRDNAIVDYNLYYNRFNDGKLIAFYGGSGGVESYTPDTWDDYTSTYSHLDQHSLVAYPNFTDTTGRDFSVPETSPAVGAGTPVDFVNTDFFGNQRSLLSPTIGAIEYINNDPTLAIIEAFILDEQTKAAIIDQNNHTIDIEVKNNTNVSTLSPTIGINVGANVSPASGAVQDFSSPVVYTVTAPNGTTEVDYTVTVSIAANKAPEANDVKLSGNPYIDSVLTVSYNYSDYENDPEGASVINWYVNNVQQAETGVNYTVKSADSSFHIYAAVTPVASAGELQGTAVNSDTLGPVVPFSTRITSSELGDYADNVIVVKFDRTLNQSVIPAINDFVVTEDGNNYGLASVSVEGNRLLIALDSSGVWGSEYLLTYTKGQNALQSNDGILVLNFSDTLIENNIASSYYENLFLYSEQLDNNQWGKPQNTIVTPDQYTDLEGETTMELLEAPSDGNRMILVGQIVELKPNTRYTVAFDVQSDNPNTGEDGWQWGYNEDGKGWVYELYGDSVSAEVKRLSFEFETSATGNQVDIRLIDRYSPANDVHIGRAQLYEGKTGSKLYVETTGSPIIPDVTGGGEAPEVSVEYSSDMSKGVVYNLDASGSTDKNGSGLFFEWTIPEGFSVSSTSGEQIQVLPTHILENRGYEFEVMVSNGSHSSTQKLLINVGDYKTEVKQLKIVDANASNSQEGNLPLNIFDGNTETRWSAQGDGESVTVELDSISAISFVKLYFYQGETRTAYFDIQGSDDNETWDNILSSNSCGFSSGYQVFNVSETFSSSDYQYLRLVGHGNSANDWNSYSEIEIYGEVTEKNDQSSLGVGQITPLNYTIYPNPANRLLNIEAPEGTTVAITDITGKITDSFTLLGEKIVRDIDYAPGMYLITFETAGQVKALKLIIR